MNKNYLILGLLLLGLLTEQAGFAADEPPAKPAPKPTLKSATSSHAIRMTVQNGIVDLIQNTKQARINLSWEPLPASSSLQNPLVRPSESIDFDVPNRELGHPDQWSKRIDSKLQGEVAKALGMAAGDGLASFDREKTDRAFIRFWGDNVAKQVGQVRVLDRKLVFGAKRDHNFATLLLGSEGIAYFVTVEGPEVVGNDFHNNTFVSDGKDVTWHFRLFKHRVTKDLDLYRWAISANMSPRTLLFPKAEASEATLRTGIRLKDTESTAGLLQTLLSGDPMGIPLELGSDGLKDVQKQTTDLEAVLSLGAPGVNTSDLITRGLLGGSGNTSIMTGAIVGKKNIDQLFGVNREFGATDKISPGILFGLSPSGNKPLYLGPSLRYGIFTLSAGWKVFEREEERKNAAGKTVKETFTLGRPAGVISVDLSRATGAKKKNQIVLDSASAGGDWGKNSDELSNDLALIKQTIDTTGISADLKGKYFELEQTSKADGNAVETDLKLKSERSTFRIPLDLKPGGALEIVVFRPRGKYRYSKLDLPAGYELWEGTGLTAIKVEDRTPIWTGDEAFWPTWILKRKP